VRLWAGAGTALLSALLLTWLLLRSSGADGPAYAEALQAINRYILNEASLHRDVLRARAGLLQNYDPLVQEADQMDDEVVHLRMHARQLGADPAALDRLAAATAEQQALTERFKSSNALLQNSLAYFDLLSTGQDGSARELHLTAGALASAMLHLTLDATPQSAQAVQDQIVQLEAEAPPASRVAATRMLAAHARMLLGLLPDVDQVIRVLLAVPSETHLEAVRAEVGARHAEAELEARRYRLLLYGVALLLLLALFQLALWLRDKATALRSQANFEHIIAKTSTSLINCSQAEMSGLLRQVLSELSLNMGAQRAYVVLNDRPVRMHTWSVDGVAYPPGWPEKALRLAGRPGAADAGIVVVADAEAPLPGNQRASTVPGVRGVACVPLIRAGQLRGVMGFDFPRPLRSRQFAASSLVRLAGDAVANAIERDILERDRDKLLARLDRARRMQTVGGLTSGIAHNFNNILGAILGYAEMAGASLAPGAKLARHIDEIRRASEQGRDLVEHILAFGRHRDTRTQSVPIRVLLGDAASMLRASLPRTIDLAVQDVAAEMAILGEPAQLQQIVLNLCTNAAQAMEGIGRIAVTAESCQIVERRSLSHGELASGRYVRLVVSDTGRGFDKATAQRVFEPFFTTRQAGTGLGLATVLEIVRDHEGAMDVQSVPGQGSSFETWLPEAASTAGTLAALPLGRGATVLVLESEHERLLGDEDMLAALGYEPVGFSVAADALAACRAAPERFDALIIGCTLPKVEALQLARVLHRVAPSLPLLFTIGSDTEFSAGVLAESGVTDVLHWPLTSMELAAALTRCLRLTETLGNQGGR